MITMILGFLRGYWQYVIIGIGVLALVGYISFLKINRDHWKEKAGELQLVINQAKDREVALSLGNEAITKRYQSSLVELKSRTEEVVKLNQERIEKDEELNRLTVSLNAVRLFNQSKRNPSTIVTKAEQGNAGKAQGAVTSGPATTAAVIIKEPTFSLVQIWKQVNTNDANHWKCVAQVEAWQGFWQEYEANYMGALKQTK